MLIPNTPENRKYAKAIFDALCKGLGKTSYLDKARLDPQPSFKGTWALLYAEDQSYAIPGFQIIEYLDDDGMTYKEIIHIVDAPFMLYDQRELAQKKELDEALRKAEEESGGEHV